MSALHTPGTGEHYSPARCSPKAAAHAAHVLCPAFEAGALPDKQSCSSQKTGHSALKEHTVQGSRPPSRASQHISKGPGAGKAEAMPVDEPAGTSCDGLTITERLAHRPASKEHAKLPSKKVKAEQVAQQMIHVLLGEGCSVQGASAAVLAANCLSFKVQGIAAYMAGLSGTASADTHF